jgi:hypothetical protein
VLAVAVASIAPQRRAPPAPPATFAATIAALSERPGFFDTDNLISNERSYLHVVPDLRALAAKGGAGVYLGVGPDQNFSYIAHLRPSLAIVIDIRRDNLLLHLLFKALFAEARSRVEYLALLTGRAPPRLLTGWDQQPVDAIVKVIDAARPIADDAVRMLRDRLATVVAGFGVPLTDADRATIDRFHRRFIQAGLSLQFNTTGRAPQFDYPTYRDLLLEVDRQGARRSFMASESDFRFVKDLHARDRIIPIVGDLSGPTALGAVAKHLAAAKLQVAAFYTSNVEFYLFRAGMFPRFVANLERLPRQPNSLVIRSVFPAGSAGSAAVAGYNSASLTQPIETLVDGHARGRFRQYWELIR